MTKNEQSTNSRDIFGVHVLKNNHSDIRRLKRENQAATIHGNKFWKSTSLMIDYLSVAPPNKRWRVLEIGSGWGISGIYCAKAFDAKVTALDADSSVFPFLQHHAQINHVDIATLHIPYQKVSKAMLSEFDMVIGSDICFWDDMEDLLFSLINRAHQAGVKRVVMTDPGRPPFRGVAERCCEKFDAIYDHWSVPYPHNTSGLVLDIA